jgi:hypothetical protein
LYFKDIFINVYGKNSKLEISQLGRLDTIDWQKIEKGKYDLNRRIGILTSKGSQER